MKIRQATIADVKDIVQLHSDSWQVSYQGKLNSDYLARKVPQERQTFWQERFDRPSHGQQILVAEVDTRIVGFACVFLDKDPKWGSYLDNLHVSQNQQSKGIGKSLLTAVAEICTLKATSEGLCLQVTQFNTNAHRFYKRLGADSQGESTWLAPDGTSVPTYWFTWRSLDSIKNG
jgi:ribosomal protein S18 acetylase RimI-like enzyme